VAAPVDFEDVWARSYSAAAGQCILQCSSDRAPAWFKRRRNSGGPSWPIRRRSFSSSPLSAPFSPRRLSPSRLRTPAAMVKRRARNGRPGCMSTHRIITSRSTGIRTQIRTSNWAGAAPGSVENYRSSGTLCGSARTAHAVLRAPLSPAPRLPHPDCRTLIAPREDAVRGASGARASLPGRLWSSPFGPHYSHDDHNCLTEWPRSAHAIGGARLGRGRSEGSGTATSN